MAETADQPVHPSHFDVFLGGFGEPNYRIVWDGSALWYYTDDFAAPKEDDEPTEILIPSKSQWHNFWQEMDAVGLWTWRPSYNAPDIMDGTQWEVEIEWGTRAVSSSGSNRYPAYEEESVEAGGQTQRFERFAQAIRELLGDRPFD
jgi:hypothetical protein